MPIGQLFARLREENGSGFERHLLPALLSIASLLFDLSTPRGIAGGTLYVALVCCARLYREPRASYVLAACGTLFTLIGFLGKSVGHTPIWVSMVNRTLCIGVLWLGAALFCNEKRRAMKLTAVRSRADALLAVLSNAGDAIIGKSLDGIIFTWNTGAEKLFGIPAQEMIGRSTAILIPPELREEELSILQRAQDGRSVERLETRRLRKDGSSVDVSISTYPMRAESGEIESVFRTVRDISDRKQVECALHESEERYALAVRGMSVGVWEWDLRTSNLHLSPRYCEIVGIDCNPQGGQFASLRDRIHPEDQARVIELLQAHLRREGNFDTEYRFRHENGRFIWLRATAQASWDAAGKPVKVVGSIDDITERKHVEERFQLIVREAPYALLMADKRGTIQVANRRVTETFGWSNEELVGQKVELLMPERYRVQHSDIRGRYMEWVEQKSPDARSMSPGSCRVGIRRSGEEFPVDVGFIAFCHDDEPMVLCSVIEATERLRAEEDRNRFQERLEQQVSERTEQLVKANYDLEQFAFVASHDLKAPLRVIDNASKWLEEDLDQYLGGETRENMNLLRGRVRRMEKLLDDLLEYSRIGRKFDDSYSETVEGSVLIENILELLVPPPGFRVDISPAFSAAKFTRMPLQQILYNLINNAIKHHDKKVGLIEVKLEVSAADYHFTVVDDGPGIPKPYHEEVFKMFQTLKPRDQVEGSGMGLAVVRKQVETFGGMLSLESEEGRGCTFRFTLPMKQRARI